MDNFDQTMEEALDTLAQDLDGECDWLLRVQSADAARHTVGESLPVFAVLHPIAMRAAMNSPPKSDGRSRLRAYLEAAMNLNTFMANAVSAGQLVVRDKATRVPLSVYPLAPTQHSMWSETAHGYDEDRLALEQMLHWPLRYPFPGDETIVDACDVSALLQQSGIRLEEEQSHSSEQRAEHAPNSRQNGVIQVGPKGPTRKFATTKEICGAFPAPPTVDPGRWESGRYLADRCPKWARAAKELGGGRGSIASWNPAVFARGLARECGLGHKQAELIIKRNFPDYCDEWDAIAAEDEHLQYR